MSGTGGWARFRVVCPGDCQSGWSATLGAVDAYYAQRVGRWCVTVMVRADGVPHWEQLLHKVHNGVDNPTGPALVGCNDHPAQAQPVRGQPTQPATCHFVSRRNAQLAGRASVELHTLIFFRGRQVVADARVTKVRCLRACWCRLVS